MHMLFIWVCFRTAKNKNTDKSNYDNDSWQHYLYIIYAKLRLLYCTLYSLVQSWLVYVMLLITAYWGFYLMWWTNTSLLNVIIDLTFSCGYVQCSYVFCEFFSLCTASVLCVCQLTTCAVSLYVCNCFSCCHSLANKDSYIPNDLHVPTTTDSVTAKAFS